MSDVEVIVARLDERHKNLCKSLDEIVSKMEGIYGRLNNITEAQIRCDERVSTLEEKNKNNLISTTTVEIIRALLIITVTLLGLAVV